ELRRLQQRRLAAKPSADGRTHWGEFDRVSPISEFWGADRGRCIDRHYIEAFLQQHVSDVAGAVLEVNDDDYTREFGGNRITRSDVTDIEPTNRRATIVADLRSAPAIPSNTYDCVILTQTLHVIFDAKAVLREVARIMRPGGVLLATLPFASR